MPYAIVRKKCKTADGKDGRFVLVKRATGEAVSCHETRSKAAAAAGAIAASESQQQPPPSGGA